MPDINKNIDAASLLRLDMLASLEKYTRAMFKVQYNRSFVINSHHIALFNALQDVVDGKCSRLIINMPPRYSKTEVVVKSFISWCFALNATCRFLHLSYSDMLVNDNSNTIRQIMQEPLYTTLFPDAKLAKDKAGGSRWKTKAGGELYAVSTQGQVTGFGAGKVDDLEQSSSTVLDYMQEYDEELAKLLDFIGANENIFQGAIVIDDPLKPEDALSDTIRERVNQRFENTIRNRTNSRKTPIIVIMQRLHEHDLCGYLMEKEPDVWRVLSLPAIQIDSMGNESALWELKHNLQELHKMRDIDPLVFDTQYMQDPTPKEGLLYSNGFGTYTSEQIPRGKDVHRYNYTDTADTGADFLCSINFIDTPEFIYILDVLYTTKPMEVTEPATAKMISDGGIEVAKIEGNNGGRGFARNVKSIMMRIFRNFKTRIVTFTQTANKWVRIYSRSAEVQNTILFPEGWERKWPLFHSAIMAYRKDNKRKSQHDDAVDALTGVMEMHGVNPNRSKIKKRN